MKTVIDLVEIRDPATDLDLALQAAQLILEIGNYKSTRDAAMVLGNMAGRTTVVALDGYDQVVGTAGVRRVDTYLGMLEDVVADPRKRRRGIGKTVVRAAETIAFSQGILELSLASTSLGVPFYRDLGYTQLDKHTFRKIL